MKSVLLVIFFFGGFTVSKSQHKPTYLVTYRYYQKVAMPESTAKSNLDSTQSQSGLSNRQLQSLLESILPDSLDMTLTIQIFANPDSSKSLYTQDGFDDDEGGVKVRVNTPDTFYYHNQQWTQKGNKGKAIPLRDLEMTETKDRKKILGYDCVKFVLLNERKQEEVIIWATKDLPNTLLPYTGLRGFKYGILEVDNKKEKWKAIATVIKKIY